MVGTEGSSSYSIGSSRCQSEKGRRGWSNHEEEALLSGLKEIIQTDWKSENGFRPGYQAALERYMAKALPGTDLKATPHINSKIHTWKRNHASLFSMLSKLRIGYNSSTKKIEATDEAWESYVKVDINAKGMRNRSWPMYDAWCEIFGKDRANEEMAEGFVEAVNEVLNENVSREDIAFNRFNEALEGINETAETEPTSKSPSTNSARSEGRKKRKVMETPSSICELLGKFHKFTEARLGEIASRIGYEFDISRSRKELWAVVETFTSMTMHEKLRVSSLLVGNTEQLELFFSLPEQEREEFALMKLAGNI